MTVSYPNEIYSTCAFIGFLLCCIPFPWHLEAWNTGTCLYMFWTSLACLNQFINSVIWRGNVINWAPVWCDISARITIGINVAIPVASLCINRRLYHISCVRSVTVSKAEKRRAVVVDMAIGLGVPLIFMVLQYIPQGHRFDIWEDIGCFPFTYNTPVALALVSIPPIIIGLISGVYGVLSIRSFLLLRSQFQEVLSVNKNLRVGRYLRLMMLSGIETVSTLSIGSYALYLNITVLEPWKGWEDTHVDFSFVGQYPAVLWRATPFAPMLELSRWLVIVCAVVFFIFFGFAEEARKNYRSAAQSVVKHVGVSTGSFGTGSTFSSKGSKSSTSLSATASGGTLPVFVKRDALRHHDSLDTLSDMSASFIDVEGVMIDEKGGGAAARSGVPPVIRVETVGYEGMDLPDVGGVLADYKPGPYSPAPSSGPSSASSVTSFPETARPPALARPESFMVEVSSVRCSRVADESPRRSSFDRRPSV